MSATHLLLRALSLAVLMWLASSSLVNAQHASRQSVNDAIREIPWNDMVDQVVTLDGVAWGGFSKGLGQYVASPSQQVYLNSLARKPEEIEGRLVRVTGILRRHHMPAAPPGAQGYGQAFDYYSIDAFSVEVIEKLERDQLVPVAEDWIYVGMDAAKALEMMAARKLTESPMALAPPRDGSVIHGFHLEGDMSVVFSTLNNQVVSLSTRKHSPRGRKYDEWAGVRGYRLPPRPEESSVPAKGLRKGLP